MKKNSSMRILSKPVSACLIVAMAFVASFINIPSSDAAAAYACGSQCNGKATGWVIPGKGFACANDGRIVKSGKPTAAQTSPQEQSYNDTHIKVSVYYSAKCQTLWAKVTNTNSAGRKYCGVYMSRFITTKYSKSLACPKTGSTITTTMLNDYSPTKGAAASIEVNTTNNANKASRFYFSY